jgi:hypothetical protein
MDRSASDHGQKTETLAHDVGGFSREKACSWLVPQRKLSTPLDEALRCLFKPSILGQYGMSSL